MVFLCSNNGSLAGMQALGIEPKSRAWKALILPLKYASMMGCMKGIKPFPRDSQSLMLSLQYMQHIVLNFSGLGENRTPDSRIKSPVLYHLVTNPVCVNKG